MATFPIIQKLGGRDAAHEALKKKGFKGGRDAIRMWEARGSIPGSALVQLIEIAEERRIRTRAADFQTIEIAA